MSKKETLYVNYEMFGAVGDGVTDDSEAIRKAHLYANENNFEVKTDPFATYYIGPEPLNVPIKTSVDFGNSKFIIDDTKVDIDKRNANIFTVLSSYDSYKVDTVKSIKKNQMKLDMTFPRNCYVKVSNSNKKQFIRFGLNQNNGSAQTDCFVVDSSGYILNKVIWDFEQITDMLVCPIDETQLTIKGGIFTTIANQAESRYTYFGRGIEIRRSNTVVEGLTNFVEGELDHGAPYRGFISVQDCAHVTIKDTHLAPHKTYVTIGAAGAPVSMGTYAFNASSAVDVKLINIKQNGIMDFSHWGLMGTNHCKDMFVEGCTMSRYDAHENVANLTIKNTVLGHQCFNAIGCGVMTVENVTAYGNSFLNLRGDYGSNWDGDVVFKNNTWYPNANAKAPCIIGASNAGDHDFGFECHFPHKITVDKMLICDGDSEDGYTGASLMNVNVNTKDCVDHTDKTKAHPYFCSEKIVLSDIKTESGKGLKIFSGDTKNLFSEKKHTVNGDVIKPNLRVIIEDVEMPKTPLLPETALSEQDYGNNHHIVPYIEVIDCENVVLAQTNTPAIIKLSESTVADA